MIFVLDNFDSFTYNIVQYLQQLGCEVVVRRNNAVTVDEVIAMNPEAIVLSPGPGRPEKAGIMLELIDRAKGLTGTERVILRYYAEGYAVKDISGLLFISVGTVKGHNSHIYSKLGVDSYDSLKAYLDILRRCERLEELLAKEAEQRSPFPQTAPEPSLL